MKIARLLPTVALFALPVVGAVVAPLSAYADASSATPPATTASKGLYVSGDVVLSGICQVEGQYRPGQMMVFRAQVLETDGTAIDPKSLTVTTNIPGGAPVKMNYDPGAKAWVGTYVIPMTAKPGFLPYTITAKDASGHAGQFVPLGMPPAIVDGTFAVKVNGTQITTVDEKSATVALYPIIQLLRSQGFEAKWDGKTLSLTNSHVDASKLPPAEGQGPYSITVNGKDVFNATGQVIKDPATNKNTTYISADVMGFLTDFLGHGNPAAASFTGYEFDVNTQAASGSGN